MSRKRAQWTTRAPGMRWHVAVLAPRADAGGERPGVTVEVPEALPHWPDAMESVRELDARVTFLCTTRQQAEDAARAAARDLPTHRRVPLERVLAGSWGPVS